MVMIRENGPGLKVPVILGSQPPERIAEETQALGAAKVVPLQLGTTRHHVSSGFGEPVHRAVGPVPHLHPAGAARLGVR